MPYKGPGFYNGLGERVCSFHPESMMEFIDNTLDGYVLVENTEDFEDLKEDIIEQTRRDLKNELYGPRKQYHLDSAEDRLRSLAEDIKWGGTK